MRNFGTLVVSVMAVVWAAIALIAARAPIWTLLAPMAVSAILFTLVGSATPQTSPGGGRVIMFASIGEGIGILLGVNILYRIGRPDLWACVLAACVGLHFIPMARWMPAPRLYFTAACLLLAAGLGVILPPGTRNIVIGALGCTALWGTALSVLIRRREARQPC